MSDSFLAGAATRSIMPPAEMAGGKVHPLMGVRFDEPGSPLRVKAVALTLGEQSVVLVALDLCYAAEDHALPLRQAIAEGTGLTIDDVVVSCTHSHSTPDLEPLAEAHPYFDLVLHASVEAACAARSARRPGRIGRGLAHVAGAAFNQRVPLDNGGVRFTRDFREGLAADGVTDPRLSVLRIDDDSGTPIAGWVRFAAHPACVIFNPPASAEYPGYLTDRLSETVAGGAPVLFGYGVSGDVNCVPMFGTENDVRNLGLNLAALAQPVFENIETRTPQRLLRGNRTVNLPLDQPPSIETLDREIAEVAAFVAGVEQDPDLEWVLGVNCVKHWSAQQKQALARPLGEWSEQTKAAIVAGRTFPRTWPAEIAAWIIDDLALVFYGGEPFTAIGLDITARSPLAETLVMAHANGMAGYLATDEQRRRGGYEPCTSYRYARPGRQRPLSYASGAAEVMTAGCLALIDSLLHGE